MRVRKDSRPPQIVSPAERYLSLVLGAACARLALRVRDLRSRRAPAPIPVYSYGLLNKAAS